MIEDHTEVYPSQHHDSHGQSKKFVLLKEKAEPDYNIEFIASSGWFMIQESLLITYHESESSADVKAAEEYSETL